MKRNSIYAISLLFPFCLEAFMGGAEAMKSFKPNPTSSASLFCTAGNKNVSLPSVPIDIEFSAFLTTVADNPLAEPSIDVYSLVTKTDISSLFGTTQHFSECYMDALPGRLRVHISMWTARSLINVACEQLGLKNFLNMGSDTTSAVSLVRGQMPGLSHILLPSFIDSNFLPQCVYPKRISSDNFDFNLSLDTKKLSEFSETPDIDLRLENIATIISYKTGLDFPSEIEHNTRSLIEWFRDNWQSLRPVIDKPSFLEVDYIDW